MQVTDKRQPGWYRRSRKKLLSLLITDVVSRDKGFFFLMNVMPGPGDGEGFRINSRFEGKELR